MPVGRHGKHDAAFGRRSTMVDIREDDQLISKNEVLEIFDCVLPGIFAALRRFCEEGQGN
jgi:hypothetical protein